MGKGKGHRVLLLRPWSCAFALGAGGLQPMDPVAPVAPEHNITSAELRKDVTTIHVDPRPGTANTQHYDRCFP